MPKIYEYLGIVIFFYSNEHNPIHVHGEHDGKESKAEFIIKNGRVVNIKIKPKRPRRGLEGSDLKNFTVLVEKYADEIVQK